MPETNLTIYKSLSLFTSFIVFMLKKANFPTKICLTCHRPFAWRKKWKAVWDDVKYCSDACRKSRNKKLGET